MSPRAPLAVGGTLWALSRNPNSKIILASYGDELAREHSHAARTLVAEHADALGFRLSPDKTATGRWRVEGHGGGLLATGIMSGVTGFGPICWWSMTRSRTPPRPIAPPTAAACCTSFVRRF